MSRLRLALLLAGGAILWAQPADPDALLTRGRARIRAAIRSLPKYTCTQTVDRRALLQTRSGLDQRGCDQIVANRKSGLVRMEIAETDRLRLDVEVADAGIEIYAWPGASRISTERIRDLVVGGPIGTGPFGPFLIDIFDNPGIQFVAEGESEMDGRAVRQYRFYVPLKSSHYRVRVANDTRVVAFDGRFWLDSESADLARLVVRVGELSRSTGTCEATTTVDFTRARLGAGEYLLPSRSLLQIVGRDALEQSNATTYSGCREFRGESTINFFGEVASGGEATTASQVHAPVIPPGLPVSIALDSAIDTDTAAAGDAVTGKILHALIGKGKRTLAPAGSTVRGRILHLAHHLRGEPYFAISIAWESLEVEGRSVPFAAMLDRPATVLETRKLPDSRMDMIRLEARRAFPAGSTFVFATAQPGYIVPAGYQAKWITK